MRSLTILPAIAAMCSVQAQQINGYRYWFDDNAASAVTTTVGATEELVLAANWPTGAIEPGFHRVSFQVRDTNGDWSVPETRYFVRSNHAINGYRFWMNDNTGSITTGSVGPDQVLTMNSLINPGTLPKDYNIVTIQFRDTDGEWSVPTTSTFVKNTGEVNGYEYWIDDDISNSTTASIGPIGVVDLIAELPAPTTWGDHLFSIRFSSTNGTWSVPLNSVYHFFTSIEELPGISDLLLFPNPVNNELGLRLNTEDARTLNLQVLDISGAVVRDLSTWSVSGSAYRNWDISALASGSYVLRMSDGQGTWSSRFVKQ